MAATGRQPTALGLDRCGLVARHAETSLKTCSPFLNSCWHDKGISFENRNFYFCKLSALLEVKKRILGSEEYDTVSSTAMVGLAYNFGFDRTQPNSCLCK